MLCGGYMSRSMLACHHECHLSFGPRLLNPESPEFEYARTAAETSQPVVLTP